MTVLQILQVCHDYAGPFRSVCRQYAAAFDGHAVTTVFLTGVPDQEVVRQVGGDQVIFFELDTLSLRGIKISLILRMAKLMRSQYFDLAIGHRYKAIYLLGIMSYFFQLPKIIAVAHEHEVFKRKTRQLFVTFWRRKILLVGVSESVTRNILSYCPKLLAQNRLFTLPNVIDLGQEAEVLERSKAREGLGLIQKDFVFGITGRLVAKKKHELLISAFAALNHLPVKLVIIGEGNRRAALEALVDQLGIRERIVFTGHQSQAARLVRAFDVFVLCSGAEEAFGLVLLEAMLAKVPVLSTDALGPKEVLGSAGLLFKNGDVADLAVKLDQLYAMPVNERTTMAQLGYDRVRAHYHQLSFNEKICRLPEVSGLLE